MKIPGHCSVTGEPCFDVIEYWPAGHTFDGQPKRLGAPHDDALRVTFVTMKGTLMVLTICEAALPDIVVNLPAVWASVKARYRAERKAHKELGQVDFNDKQHAACDQVNLDVNDNPPLGVLCVERWKGFENAAN